MSFSGFSLSPCAVCCKRRVPDASLSRADALTPGGHFSSRHSSNLCDFVHRVRVVVGAGAALLTISRSYIFAYVVNKVQDLECIPVLGALPVAWRRAPCFFFCN